MIASEFPCFINSYSITGPLPLAVRRGVLSFTRPGQQIFLCQLLPSSTPSQKSLVCSGPPPPPLDGGPLLIAKFSDHRFSALLQELRRR